jgi:DNA-binding CsgD family transcriptional regulator
MPEWVMGEDVLMLTPLQDRILILILHGLTNREIAERLGVSPGTVGTQIGRILQRLGLTSRADIVGRHQPGRI